MVKWSYSTPYNNFDLGLILKLILHAKKLGLNIYKALMIANTSLFVKILLYHLKEGSHMATTGELIPDDGNEDPRDAVAATDFDPRFVALDFTVEDLAFLASVEGRPYAGLIRDFSEISQLYYDAIAEGVENGNVEVISLKGVEGRRLSDAIDKFTSLVMELPLLIYRKGVDDEQAVGMLVRIMIADGIRRTRIYRTLVSDPDVRFDNIDPEFASALVNGAYNVEVEGSEEDHYKARGLQLMWVWGQILNTDIDILGRSLIDDRQEERMDRAVSIILGEQNGKRLNQIGKHVLDVGKLALGVAAGIILSRSFGKRG